MIVIELSAPPGAKSSRAPVSHAAASTPLPTGSLATMVPDLESSTTLVSLHPIAERNPDWFEPDEPERVALGS